MGTDSMPEGTQGHDLARGEWALARILTMLEPQYGMQDLMVVGPIKKAYPDLEVEDRMPRAVSIIADAILQEALQWGDLDEDQEFVPFSEKPEQALSMLLKRWVAGVGLEREPEFEIGWAWRGKNTQATLDSFYARGWRPEPWFGEYDGPDLCGPIEQCGGSRALVRRTLDGPHSNTGERKASSMTVA